MNDLLNDNEMVDMQFITAYTKMTDKYFYKLISEGKFPKQIKIGRSSRWFKKEVVEWLMERVRESRG
ncbi:Rha family transcriptional regulator [Brenneria roseae subsp. americana]|uniref:Rha family transcriptional regulator n=1 Tax=Brenneria roseae subsp. americana TaxID=1508507 RepID=A0A2U1TYG3_9GAMM|nr:AlpA family phage regulatory protein [Brenneria roseae]PWC14443.1 Rha family transcriptional regulator [Brenneria roseae subsp. americana]